MHKKSFAAALLLVATAGRAQTATAPFTPGPDTTLVSGPLLPDGTIDYLAAINTLLAKGVTPDNNAAAVLYAIVQPSSRITRVVAALHGKPQTLAQPLRSIGEYAAATSKTGYDDDALNVQQRTLMQRPWKTSDAPLFSAWLDESAPALALARSAADLPQYDVPWIADPPGAGWPKAIPLDSPLSLAAHAFITRAMRYAGANELDHARDDLRAAQRLALLATKGRTEIALLPGSATETRVLQAYAALITLLPLTPQQLDTLQADLQQSPVHEIADAPLDIESLLCLGSVMLCISHKEGDILRDAAGEFTPDATVNPGDLHRADWNVVLRTIVALNDKIAAARALPDFAKRQAALTQLAADDPFPNLWDISDTDADPHKARGIVETYLRRKPAETLHDYSVRVGCFIAESPAFSRRFDALRYVPVVRRQLDLLAIALQRQHQKTGAYPAALTEIAPAADTLDPFSNQPLHYQTTNGSFTLYSVGTNAQDDHAQDGDLVITNAPPPATATAPASPLTPAHADTATQTQ